MVRVRNNQYYKTNWLLRRCRHQRRTQQKRSSKIRLYGTAGLEGRPNVLSEVQNESGNELKHDLFVAVVVVSRHVNEQDWRQSGLFGNAERQRW